MSLDDTSGVPSLSSNRRSSTPAIRRMSTAPVPLSRDAGVRYRDDYGYSDLLLGLGVYPPCELGRGTEVGPLWVLLDRRV